MNLKFAFAVNKDNKFEKKHFGKADKYLIYMQVAGKIVLMSEEINYNKLLDKEPGHSLKEKGNAIIKFLKKKDVNVLVSRQFCENIALVNDHFIPINVSSEHLEEIISILRKYTHWIEDELNSKESDFGLFTIKSGILKSSIEKFT